MISPQGKFERYCADCDHRFVIQNPANPEFYCSNCSAYREAQAQRDLEDTQAYDNAHDR